MAKKKKTNKKTNNKKTNKKSAAQRRREMWFWTRCVEESLHQGLTPTKAIDAADMVVEAAWKRFGAVIQR